MSRGPGKWDRLIADQLQKRIGFALRELWIFVEPPRGPWTEAEYQALYRAVQRWAARGDCDLYHERQIATNPHRRSDPDGRLQLLLYVYRSGYAPPVRDESSDGVTREVALAYMEEGALDLIGNIVKYPASWAQSRRTSEASESADEDSGEPRSSGLLHRHTYVDTGWDDAWEMSGWDEAMDDPDYQETDPPVAEEA